MAKSSTSSSNFSQTVRLSQFRETSGYLLLLALGLLGAAAIVGKVIHQEIYQGWVNASVGSEPVLVHQWSTTRRNLFDQLGAWRIDVQASLPQNSNALFSLQLRNAENEVIGEMAKAVWYESGIWREDGESGTWHESDFRGGLDFKNIETQTISLYLSLEEFAQTNGQPVTGSLPFSLNISRNAIDTRFLWMGLIAVLLLGYFSLQSVRSSGKVVLRKSVLDSDVSDRVIIGGPDELLKVIVTVLGDESTPDHVLLDFDCRDGFGNDVYQHQQKLSMRRRRSEEGEILSARGYWQFYLWLQRRSSYYFSVEVTPDAPIDKTTITIKEGVRTLQSVIAVVVSNSQ